MFKPLDTGMRRTAALFAAVGLIALVVVPVAAGKPVPGSNEPSIQDIRTQGHNWAAKGSLLDVNGALLRKSAPSTQDILTQGNNWAAKGRLLNANGGLSKDTQSAVSGSNPFHWNEFGIGAGAMLGLVLLLGVLAVGIHVVHSGSLSQGRPA